MLQKENEKKTYTCANDCPCYKTNGKCSWCKIGFFKAPKVVDYSGNLRPCAPGAKA